LDAKLETGTFGCPFFLLPGILLHLLHEIHAIFSFHVATHGSRFNQAGKGIIMSAAILDTHAYVKKLKAVGFTEEQAEVQAEPWPTW
jgi:hypothetical protein